MDDDVCVCACTCVCVCVCHCVCMGVSLCVFCMYVCILSCMCVRMYLCLCAFHHVMPECQSACMRMCAFERCVIKRSEMTGSVDVFVFKVLMGRTVCLAVCVRVCPSVASRISETSEAIAIKFQKVTTSVLNYGNTSHVHR